MKAVIFYSITEAELSDHCLLKRGLADVASRGFDGVYIEYRNIRTGFRSPRLRKALVVVCQEAKALKMGVVFDAVYKNLSDEIKAESPEVFSETWVPQRVSVKDGCFTMAFADEIQYRSLERCWMLETRKDGHVKRYRDVTSRVQCLQATAEGGGCAMTEAKGGAVARLTYRIRGLARGELLVLVRRRFEYASLDLSHPGLRQYVTKCLDTFRGLPVNGFAWDEPHFGFAFWREDGRAVSGHLCRMFRQRFGYDLVDRLPDLWCDQPDGRSALTRLHYAELLEQGLSELEVDFAQQARRRLRGTEDAFVGIHRTMHEETGDDFLIGCCDYFRHNRHTRGGFTDSVFEREDSMVTLLQLARSLAAVKGEQAWNNSWGFVPTEAHHAYYLRLMGAMQVGWIGHTYHSSHQFGPGYPNHPLWATIKSHLTVHRKLLAALDGASAEVDTAVLYNWRAMATFAGNYLHVHRRNLLLLGQTLTAAQVQFQFVDEAGLKKGLHWKRVIVPWPDMLPAGVLADLARLAEVGVEILMFGPPAKLDAAGSPASQAFAAVCGIRLVECANELAMKEGQSLRGKTGLWRLDPTAIVPNYRSNESCSYPDHFKAYTLKPQPGTEVLATFRGHPMGVRRGFMTYFAVELPHFEGLLGSLIQEPALAEISPGWALFSYRRGAKLLLAGVAHGGKPRHATLKWLGNTHSLGRCSSFVVASEKGHFSVLFQESAHWRPTGRQGC